VAIQSWMMVSGTDCLNKDLSVLCHIESRVMIACFVRILYRKGFGLQPIRVWGGATLAAGYCLPLAAASLSHSPLGLGLGEVQHLVLLPPLAAAPLVLPALGGSSPL
jgi:hypothetical protein